MGSPQLLYERYTREGALFHRMAEQFFRGIAPNLIERQLDPIKHARVMENWRYFVSYVEENFDLKDENKVYKPEHAIRENFAGFSIEAKFDLLVLTPKTGEITIYDWKTSKLGRAAAHSAEHGIQTKVYLAAANQLRSSSYPKTHADPHMIYWFAGSPGSSIHLQPTNERIIEWEAEISVLIDRVISDKNFELTDDTEKCGLCPYRSYCGTALTPALITEENVMDIEEPFPWDVPNFDNEV